MTGKLTLARISRGGRLAAAYDATRLARGKGHRPRRPHGDQRFFIAYAQAWPRRCARNLRQRIATDGHAPGNFRALTVRNIDAWYPAFNVQPGQKLYLAPNQRVKIWG